MSGSFPVLEAYETKYVSRKTKPFTAQAFLHSRTVVESIDSISTGILSYMEGDVLEIEMPDISRFSLGEAVKVTVYSQQGVCVFYSTVIVRSTEGILVLHPLESRKRFGERREYPRVEVRLPGLFHEVIDQQAGITPLPAACEITNISVGGIGFTAGARMALQENSRFILNCSLDFKLQCLAEVVRMEVRGDRIYYGAKYVELPESMLFSLKSFVLKEQIAMYYERKRRSLSEGKTADPHPLVH